METDWRKGWTSWFEVQQKTGLPAKEATETTRICLKIYKIISAINFFQPCSFLNHNGQAFFAMS
jgi:hypothetical protein